jgi:hypothetical protein
MLQQLWWAVSALCWRTELGRKCVGRDDPPRSSEEVTFPSLTQRHHTSSPSSMALRPVFGPWPPNLLLPPYFPRLQLRFRDKSMFYRVRLSSPRSNPNLDEQGILFCLRHNLWPVRHWSPCQRHTHKCNQVLRKHCCLCGRLNREHTDRLNGKCIYEWLETIYWRLHEWLDKWMTIWMNYCYWLVNWTQTGWITRKGYIVNLVNLWINEWMNDLTGQ